MPTPSSMPLRRISGLVTNTSSPTSCTRSPRACGQRCPAVPVAFGDAVFDRDDRVLPHPVGVHLDHLRRRPRRLARLLEHVRAVAPELARGDVERQEDVLSGACSPACADGLEHDVERLAVRLQVRREAAFVADAGRVPGLLQDGAQRVEDLGAGAQRLGEGRQADRHHHELLQVDAAVGVRAAVEDVHHRHRQHVRAVGGCASAEVARGARRAARLAAAAAARAAAIDTPSSALAPSRLLVGVPSSAISCSSSARWSSARAGQRRGDLAVDVRDGRAHALAEVAPLVAVAQFERFALAGGRAGRHGGAAERARRPRRRLRRSDCRASRESRVRERA